ncbi:MAG: ABC transporter permease [Planctomycetota bacterium]
MTQIRGFLVALQQAALDALRGRRGLVLLLISLVPMLIAFFADGDRSGLRNFVYHNLVLNVAFQFVIPFCALLLGASVLGDELEGRTITYLFTRPVDRGLIYLGRLFGTGIAFSVLLAITLSAALHLRPVLNAPPWLDPFGTVKLAVGVFWVYLAIFAGVRTILKRALLVGMLYILVLDLFISHMVYIGLAQFSIWHHVAVIYTEDFERTYRGLRFLRQAIPEGAAASESVRFLAVAFGLAAFLGAWFTRTREYPVAGAVA